MTRSRSAAPSTARRSSTAARDLLGHSGLILQSIAPGSMAAYGSVVINGVSASVADNDASAVVVTPTSPMTVYEDRPGFLTATYTVVLSRAPVGGSVFVNVSPTEPTGDELAAGAQPLAFLDSGGHVVAALVLTFTAANWFLPQTVTVVVQHDNVPSGNERQVTQIFTMPTTSNTADVVLGAAPLRLERLTVNGLRIRSSEAELLADGRTVRLHLALPALAGTAVTIAYVLQDGSTSLQVIRHSISEASAPNFVGVAVPTMLVTKVDDDAAGVITTPANTSTGVTVFEGGSGDSYTVGLSRAPEAGETVTVTLSTDTTRLTLDQSVLTFTAADWAAKTVHVTAIDDAAIQGHQLVTIHHVVTSSHSVDGVANFAGITVPDMTVDVEDNDVAGVLVQESGGSTRVIEASSSVTTSGAAPFIDSYTVVLTKALAAGQTVTVHVQPGVTQTGGTVNERFTGGPGAASFTLAQTPALVARVTVDGQQLSTSEYTVTGSTVSILTTLRAGAQIAINYRVAGSAKQVVVSTSQTRPVHRRSRPRLRLYELERRADGVGRRPSTTRSSTATASRSSRRSRARRPASRARSSSRAEQI